jgi:ketosteroid isomerase-like protein
MVQTMDELIDATSSALGTGGDVTPLLVEDVLMLGTDPQEWWEGRAAAMDALHAQFAQLGLASNKPEGDRRVREHGDVAWFAEHASVTVHDQTFRLRLSGVAVRHGQDWRFAQFQVAPASDPLPITT